jgi:hypothetical protein
MLAKSTTNTVSENKEIYRFSILNKRHIHIIYLQINQLDYKHERSSGMLA